jgi:hypothetical protein
MIVNRIYEWGQVQPDKLALIHDDKAVSYADFAAAIEARRRRFIDHGLPAESQLADPGARPHHRDRR